MSDNGCVHKHTSCCLDSRERPPVQTYPTYLREPIQFNTQKKYPKPQMPGVEVLSLSVNKIKTLRVFSECHNLKELYLRKNDIGNLEDVVCLKKLQHLSVLWLCDNPCASHPLYRLYVIKMLPNLVKLDNIDVKSEERGQALHMAMEEFDGIKQQNAGGSASSPTSPRAGDAKAGGSDRSQRNVLTAVLALLNELSPSSLEAVQQDISSRLRR